MAAFRKNKRLGFIHWQRFTSSLGLAFTSILRSDLFHSGAKEALIQVRIRFETMPETKVHYVTLMNERGIRILFVTGFITHKWTEIVEN